MQQPDARQGSQDASATVVGELYAIHARRLRRMVRSAVRAPDEIIEDACQIAWSRLLVRSEAVRPEATLSWLVTTASREAIKLVRRVDRDVSLEALLEDDVEPAQSGGTDELVDLRHRLGSVHALPVRQQRLVWLAGFGFSYREMAEQTRSSRRTVERQLLRAKQALRVAA
jgi:RNA polymerase sigma factor (sigma-70 family)